MNELTDQQQAILDFERAHPHWKYLGAKQAEIRERFDMTSTRYGQVLNQLLDSPAALAYQPSTVRRLQRLRAKQQRQRSGKRLSFS